MASMTREHAKGIAALFFVTLTWAAFSIFARVLHGELGNIHQLTARLLVGTVVLVAVHPSMFSLRAIRRISRRDWGLLVVRAILLTGLGSLPWIASINSTNIATTAFIQALPFTCIWGALLFDARRPPIVWFWVGVSICGAAVMFGLFSGARLSVDSGARLAFISSVTYPIGLLLRKWHTPGPTDLQLSALLMLFGALQCVLYAICVGEKLPPSLSLPTVLMVLFSGSLVGISLLASSYGISRVSGAVSGMIFCLEAPLSALLAAVLFGEVAAPQTMIGGIMIVAATFAITVTEHRRALSSVPH